MGPESEGQEHDDASDRKTGDTMNRRTLAVAIGAVLMSCACSLAQYPHPPQDAQHATDEAKVKADKLSDEMFAKAMPAIEADAKAGHPYIPSAAKPEDLPQADIPAFPGAEGGGMY